MYIISASKVPRVQVDLRLHSGLYWNSDSACRCPKPLHILWTLVDTYKYGVTASSHGACSHQPKGVHAAPRHGHCQSNHLSNHNRDMWRYIKLLFTHVYAS